MYTSYYQHQKEPQRQSETIIFSGRIMKISKLDAALHQLNVAITLFWEGDYLSALTLAGAAEEILGKLLKKENQESALDFIVRYHLPDITKSEPAEKRENIIRTIANLPRNAAKHIDSEIEIDPEYTLQMIMRAMPMAKKLGRPVDNEKINVDKILEYIKAHGY